MGEGLTDIVDMKRKEKSKEVTGREARYLYGKGGVFLGPTISQFCRLSQEKISTSLDLT